VLTQRWSWWWKRFRSAPVAIGLVVLAAIVNGLWTVTFIRSADASPANSYTHDVLLAFKAIKRDAQGLFSRFGWVDVDTSAHLWVLGYVAAAILIGSCLVGMVSGGRWKFVAIGAMTGLITLVVTVTEIVGGYVFQARYTLAILAPLGFLAVAAQPSDRDTSRFPRWCIALMVIVNGAAMYGNARRYAVGERGSIFFPFDAKWSPPGGWWLTTIVALVGLGSLGVTGFQSWSTPGHEDRGRRNGMIEIWAGHRRRAAN